MRSSKILLLSIVLFFYQCSTSSIKDVNWIVGSWKHGLSENHFQIEQWESKQDTLVGERWLVKETDSVLMQEMKLFINQGDIQLAIFPVDAPYSLAYEAELQTKDRLVFKNVQPIFPEVLEYELIRDTLLVYQKGRTQNMVNEAVFAFIPVEPAE